jgi:hypothetical protein
MPTPTRPVVCPGPIVAPSQVWPRLATEWQGRTIWLLAHLAFNVVAAQDAVPALESAHARIRRFPSRSSR